MHTHTHIHTQEELHDMAEVHRAWDDTNQKALGTQMRLDEVCTCVCVCVFRPFFV